MASIVFDETEIVLNPTCALFVTMEAPRAIQRKIPDNFKVVNCRILLEMIKVIFVAQMMISYSDNDDNDHIDVQVLFRSIAMSRPDPKMIIDLLLASKGFSKSAQLARLVLRVSLTSMHLQFAILHLLFVLHLTFQTAEFNV